MIKYRFSAVLFVVVLMTMFGFQGFGQSKAKIANVDFYLENTDLVVTYDILNAAPSETFTIWLKVNTISGKTLNPVSLSGDIGEGVTGGGSKQIVWHLDKDEVEIDDEITIEVLASSTYSGPGQQEFKAEKVEKVKKVSVGKAVIFSLILPGAGNAYVSGGGSQWLWGIVGYGCIAGSVVMNNRAYDLLDDYRQSTDIDERDQFYNDAKTSKTVSNVLLGTAATIWVVDLIWTAAQASNVNKKYRNSNLSFHYSYEPINRAPMVGLTYKF